MPSYLVGKLKIRSLGRLFVIVDIYLRYLIEETYYSFSLNNLASIYSSSRVRFLSYKLSIIKITWFFDYFLRYSSAQKYISDPCSKKYSVLFCFYLIIFAYFPSKSSLSDRIFGSLEGNLSAFIPIFLIIFYHQATT